MKNSVYSSVGRGRILLLCIVFVAATGQNVRKGDVRQESSSQESSAQTSSGSRAENWTMWGGPRRDFITSSTGILGGQDAGWISKPPVKLWERPLGDGYSPIAEENGVLYTAYRRGSNDVVIALDARSGETIWEYDYKAPFRNAYSERVGPGPYAMPQVVGNRVVTASGDGQIHSIDKKTGKPVWSRNLYAEFGGNRLEFGYSSHALPYKDTLIVLAGGKQGAVVKLRQSDGGIIWKKHDLRIAHSSPILIEVDGQKQVAALLAQEIIGLDPESGDLLWRHEPPTEYGLAVSTPVWAGGNLLFLSTAYGGGSRVLQLTRSGRETKVAEVWHNRRVQSHFGTVIRQGNQLYLSSGQNGPSFI
ncbi:MAG: PQQ-binding-like beta-propeller repeat protein, partial [Bryobacteraceae bacterium]